MLEAGIGRSIASRAGVGGGDGAGGDGGEEDVARNIGLKQRSAGWRIYRQCVARLNGDPTQGLSWGTNCAIVRQAWRWREDTIDRHNDHQTDEAEAIPTRTMTGLSHGLSGGLKAEGSFRSLRSTLPRQSHFAELCSSSVMLTDGTRPGGT
jgi:hypothetical protein